jgi:hypothetical protein
MYILPYIGRFVNRNTEVYEVLTVPDQLIRGIVKKCAVKEYPKSVIDRYQAAW